MEQQKQPLKNEVEKYKKLAQEKVEELKKLAKLDGETKWQKDKDEEDVKVHVVNNFQGTQVLIRGEGVINRGIEDIKANLADFPKRREYEKQYTVAEIVEVLADNLRVIYGRTKSGVFLIDDRDFLQISTHVKEGNSYIFASTSIEHPVRPTGEKCVRAQVYIHGFILTPIDEKKTNIITISCSDPCGNLPEILKRKGARQRIDTIVKLKKFMEGKEVVHKQEQTQEQAMSSD